MLAKGASVDSAGSRPVGEELDFIKTRLKLNPSYKKC